MNENKPRRRAQAQAAQKATRKSGLSRFVLMVTMMALVAVVSIGGTMAWLQDNTEEVVNTFTTSNIDIEIDEDDAEEDGEGNLVQSFKMVPNADITKRPTATVLADSEACYLFVKIEKTNPTFKENAASTGKTFDDYLTYQVIDANYQGDKTYFWTRLEGVEDIVYYMTVAAADADQEFEILAGNKVHVVDDVTKQMMNDIAENGEPKLTFTAYAIQQANGSSTFTAFDAWTQISAN